MSNEPFERLKDTYPPTPPAFTESVDGRLAALPDRGARWRPPTRYIAAYAAAACAVAALVVTGIALPAGIGATASAGPASAPPSPSAAASQTLPPADPMPKLPVTMLDHAPASADGWQAAAVAGDVTWYYNTKTHALARTDEYKSYLEIYSSGDTPEPNATAIELWLSPETVEIALDPASGQSIDADSFFPGQDGRWIAFTVHEGGGDKIWVVTSDGRKMVVPDDVRWVDGNERPVEFDFSGASMLVMGESLAYRSTMAVSSSDTVGNGLRIKAMFPEGDIYLLEVSFDAAIDDTDMRLDDRKGIYSFSESKTSDQAIVNTRSYLVAVSESDGGKYVLTMGGRQFTVALQSNRFALIKFSGDPYSPAFYPSRALLVYQDDPGRTLWELDIGTGQLTEIAAGCVSADWVDGKTYWYATKADSAAVLRREAPGADAVDCQIVLAVGIPPTSPSDALAVNASAFIMVILQNNTAADVTIPNDIPCSLRVRSGGNPVWSKEGSFPLSDAQGAFVSRYDSDGASVDKGPVTLHPGEILRFQIPEFVYAVSDGITMEGSFYNANAISYASDYQFGIPKPADVSITGAIARDGRLELTIGNKSRATFIIQQPGYVKSFYPPFVYYRLLSDGRVIDSGKFRLDKGALTPAQADIPPGGTLTLSESGDVPKLAGLPAGSYTLQCCMEYDAASDSQYDSPPWGSVLGYYFDILFTMK